MNRILFPLLAIATVALAFFSFIAVSVVGLIGIGLFGMVRAVSRLTGGQVSARSQEYAKAKATHGNENTAGINRVWNDGRGTIIDM